MTRSLTAKRSAKTATASYRRLTENPREHGGMRGRTGELEHRLVCPRPPVGLAARRHARHHAQRIDRRGGEPERLNTLVGPCRRGHKRAEHRIREVRSPRGNPAWLFVTESRKQFVELARDPAPPSKRRDTDVLDRVFVVGVGEGVPDELPDGRTVRDCSLRGGLEVPKNPVGDEVGVCAAQQSAEPKRWVEHKPLCPEIQVILDSSRRQARQVLDAERRHDPRGVGRQRGVVHQRLDDVPTHDQGTRTNEKVEPGKYKRQAA